MLLILTEQMSNKFFYETLYLLYMKDGLSSVQCPTIKYLYDYVGLILCQEECSYLIRLGLQLIFGKQFVDENKCWLIPHLGMGKQTVKRIVENSVCQKTP